MRALFIHVGVLLGAAFAGSALISLYGETCGIHFTRPSTWFRVFISAGSPWCKALNYTTSACSYFLDHMWVHAVGLLITCTNTWACSYSGDSTPHKTQTPIECPTVRPIPVAEISPIVNRSFSSQSVKSCARSVRI